MASSGSEKEKENEKTPILRISNVTKKYKEKLVIDNINMDVYAGEIFGIIGVSGAGKTTLLEMMIGFLQPDKGKVEFRPSGILSNKESGLYKSVYSEKKEVRRIFGFSTQMPSFYDNLTVRENLIYFGALYDIRSEVLDKNIEHSLKLVGLFNHQHVLASHLSGGMQKRLDVACALIHDPDILILDEPTADLDITSRKKMWELVRSINEKGTTVIVASHFLEEIEILCERIALLHDKKIISLGTLEELRNKYAKNEEIFLLTTPGNYASIIKKLKQNKVEINNVARSGNGIIIYTPVAEKAVHQIMHLVDKSREKIINIDMRKPPLSELFESLTKNVEKTD